jgi:membrane protease YdiL (CAAX protease family)
VTERRTGSREDAVLDVAAVVALLVLSNVAANRLLPAWSYVAWNLAVAGLLVLLARRGGLSRQELGFRRWSSGLRWGLAASAIVVGVYAVALALPPTRDLFRDRRVGEGASALAYHALVRIPLGTVVLEEVAFRSVLPAFAARRYGVSTGVAIASVLFGLWHVLPALGIVDVNPVASETFSGSGGTALAVVGAVLATTLAGIVLCWLRYRSGSVLASVLVHITTNSLGFTLAWLVR